MGFIDEFNEALEKGYIKTYYQPLIRTISGDVCSAEALARWIDPNKGMILPNEFIQKLEDEKLIYKLDLHMIENVCKFYKEFDNKNLKFTVNLSRIDFSQIDMFEAITNILKKYDVPTNVLHLEITESSMLENTRRTKEIFSQFHNAGFEIWIDDFGSGFSSLSILRDYPFDVLKIDMSLIQRFDNNSKKILSSLINMSKRLGIHSLAEGVESKEQLNFLKDIGCEMMQGFYFSRPIDEKSYLEFIKRNNIEDIDDYKYWNEIGKLNFLSADPLSAYSSDLNNIDVLSDIFPVALIEYKKGVIKYIYVNKKYKDELNIVGFDSVLELEKLMNSNNFDHKEPFVNQLENAISYNNIQRKDTIINNVVCSHFTKLISKNNDKYMLASSFKTVSTKRTDYLVLKYSQSLYKTYDTVTEINPDNDSAIQIYSVAGFAKIYGTVSLRKGVQEFAENEVHPNDKERYLEFFNVDNLKQRIQNYIQEQFLIKSGDGYKLKNVRISKLDNGKYLYTIQSI